MLARLGAPTEYPVSWVKLEKYVELSGDSADSVQARRKIGKWLDGQQCKIVDGRLWIDLRAAQRWVEEWDGVAPSRASKAQKK
ncbi:excisionase [Massilia eurypsychrophila]|uniref:Excisionase n=1 Tax=Massilia eurypsychrophila TaxID=1485217 RepID=A0A2G8TEE9_9BURK|nr:excisionase [Massilia eurypsychrophila]